MLSLAYGMAPGSWLLVMSTAAAADAAILSLIIASFERKSFEDTSAESRVSPGYLFD
jgi:hypothetical protein